MEFNLVVAILHTDTCGWTGAWHWPTLSIHAATRLDAERTVQSMLAPLTGATVTLEDGKSAVVEVVDATLVEV